MFDRLANVATEFAAMVEEGVVDKCTAEIVEDRLNKTRQVMLSVDSRVTLAGGELDVIEELVCDAVIGLVGALKEV